MSEKKLTISVPELMFIAATRGAIGVGVGLLLSNALSRQTRKAIGLPLFIIGALSTIPIAIQVFGKKAEEED